MMMKEEVILVDENDVETGTMEKMEAHHGAHLHRAISVFITDTQGRWLLQQRTMEKYHSKGKWSNTCCSHPAPGELTIEAANRRLLFEMGMSASLTDLFRFQYKAELENNLTEHEIDHVFLGVTNVLPTPNPDEVMNYRYLSFEELQQEIDAFPDRFSEWFKMIYQDVQHHILEQQA
jgi:isopentenyl-diphosphate delta-isomerase